MQRSNKSTTVTVIEAFGKEFSIIRAHCPKRLVFVLGNYLVEGNSLFETRCLDVEDQDETPPISPVVSFETEEMRIYVEDYFGIGTSHFPIVYEGESAGLKMVSVLKAAIGYSWSKTLLDFVETIHEKN